MADLEAVKSDKWANPSAPDDYSQAGQSFDLLEFKFQDTDPDPEEDVEYLKRNERLVQLLAKKENQLPEGISTIIIIIESCLTLHVLCSSSLQAKIEIVYLLQNKLLTSINFCFP